MTSTNPIVLEELPGTYSIHRLKSSSNPTTAAAITQLLIEPTTLFALLKSPDELSLVVDETLNKTLHKKLSAANTPVVPGAHCALLVNSTSHSPAYSQALPHLWQRRAFRFLQCPVTTLTICW